MSVYPYKLASGTKLWKVELNISGRWENGNRQRITKSGFKTKTEAKNWEVEKLADLNKGIAVASNNLTLGAYLENWHNKVAPSQRSYSAYTHRKYGNYVKIINKEFGHIKVVSLTPFYLKKIRDKLLYKKKPYSPAYVNSLEVALKSALSDGENKIGLSPLRKLKGMSQTELRGISGKLEDELDENKKIRYFEPWEQKKLLETAWEYSHGKRVYNYKIPRGKNLVPYMLIYLGLHTGMRRGELYALTLNKIDLEKGTILINRSLDFSKGDAEGFLTLTKNNQDRTIEITPSNVDELRKYKLWIQEKLLPMRADVNKVPVLFGSDLKFLHSTQPYKVFKTIVGQAKLNHRRMHDLRHTHASNLIDKEIYPPVIQKRLGHSTLDQTMSTYANFFRKRNKNLVDVLVQIESGTKVARW